MKAYCSRVKVKDASNGKEDVRFLPTLKHWVSSHDLYEYELTRQKGKEYSILQKGE